MRLRLGIVVAALVLVGGCGGSDSETPRDRSADNKHLLECHQLGIDWAVQADGRGAEVAFGKTDEIKQIHTFGLRQADRLDAKGCKQAFVQEVLAGNAGVASTLMDIAACLQRITPSVESQEFCDEAQDTYERDVVTHVDRVLELIALDRAGG